MITSRLKSAEEIMHALSEQPNRPASERKAIAYLEYNETELEDTFAALVQQWQDETGMLSLVQKKVIHPAYQRIIGFGPPVLPLILHELEVRPGHWFWALQAITGEDPAPAEATLEQARDVWLRWGREHGYLS